MIYSSSLVGESEAMKSTGPERENNVRAIVRAMSHERCKAGRFECSVSLQEIFSDYEEQKTARQHGPRTAHPIRVFFRREQPSRAGAERLAYRTDFGIQVTA